MHEMSLAENVRECIEEAARTEGYTRVTAVWLEIGRLSSVEAEAMRFCFDAAMAGSLAEGARLEIVETPGQGQCADCGCCMPLASRYEACPQCGGYRIEVTEGESMRILELEVSGCA